MQSFSTGQIRNVVLMSHSGAGKTSLTEALLFASGGVTRLGRVEDGTTTSDYEPEEVKRGGSVNMSVVPVLWKGTKVNIIDTPGYPEFLGEVCSGLRVADAAVIPISAASGVEVGTELLWKLAQDLKLPCLLVVNKMDRENADFDRSMSSIEMTFGKRCVPLNIPIGSQSGFSGVIGLLEPAQVAEHLQEEVATARERLAEAVAETDDDLATKYLEEDNLTQEELTAGLRRAILAGRIFPVLVSSATLGIGMEALLDAMATYLPSPTENLANNEQDALAALVFKTSADPYVGKLSYFRLYGGTLASDSQVWNANKGQAERFGQLFIAKGKTQEPVAQLETGDIGIVPKLTATTTGDTLSVRDNPLKLQGIEFPAPVFSMAVYPKSKQDLDKMTTSLTRLIEEDPSLRLVRESDTGELLLSGLGEVHVEIAVEKVRRKFSVDLLLQLQRVPYRETITRIAKTEYKHKKQTGGHGQYGHVLLELEPTARGAGFEFGSRVVGGNVPREYIPAVEKGVQKSLTEGVLGGYPLVDLKVTLYDGSSHPVDSSSMAFEIAGSYALRKGVGEANPVLMEPIYHLRITVPEAYAGDVMGDLNSKRGRILGMNPDGDGSTLIEAEVPLAELLHYSADLRSVTQSRGVFDMEFDRYDELPSHLMARVTEQAKKERDEAKAQ